MRIDKLSMAALAATIEHYIRGEALDKIPVWRTIAMPPDAVKQRVENWANNAGSHASAAQSKSTIGGGSLPGETLPTWALSIDCDGIEGGAEAVAKRLRDADSAVLGRIEDGRVLLDARTVLPEEEDALLATLRTALQA